MAEAQLTQEIIDGTNCEEQLEKKRGLYAAVASHPFITGGLVLAGAGLAYAVGRKVRSLDDSEVARAVHVETAIACRNGDCDQQDTRGA